MYFQHGRDAVCWITYVTLGLISNLQNVLFPNMQGHKLYLLSILNILHLPPKKLKISFNTYSFGKRAGGGLFIGEISVCIGIWFALCMFALDSRWACQFHVDCLLFLPT